VPLPSRQSWAAASPCLGSPRNKNKSVGRWGVNEQWVYYSTYLYFENGRLKSYQKFE
jgi:hypothetical protein